MNCLLNKPKIFFFTLIIASINACQNNFKEKVKQKPFEIPINEKIILDSTEIGISNIATGLDVPWDIEWGPDGQVWFTEQEGIVSKVNPHNGALTELLKIPDVERVRTLGLLGMAVSQDDEKPYVFLDYTSLKEPKEDSITVSKLVRYEYSDAFDTLQNPKVLMEVPAENPGGHNGSRVALSSDGKVFWTTGDRTKGELAQDTLSPNGKVLRLNMDGSIPDDNPFSDNPVWALGFRNAQGLAFSDDNVLFVSEHGPDDNDEINRIEKAGNYGWPNVGGFCETAEDKEFCDSMQMIEPLKAWTPTIAPAGIDYYHSNKIPEWNNSILLATLKGASLNLGVSLKVLKLNQEKRAILSEKTLFKKKFGRLRDVTVSPDGDVYIVTSNQDWNPLEDPREQDDRIIRLAKISERDNLSELEEKDDKHEGLITDAVINIDGESLYQDNCAACHKSDGEGKKGVLPHLNENKYVTGDLERLVAVILKGSSAIDEQEKAKWKNEGGMPSYEHLEDKELKELVNYIRTAWSNDADTVNINTIKSIKENIK